MLYENRVMQITCTCLIVLTSLLWSTVQVSSKVTVRMNPFEIQTDKFCGAVNCTIEHPTQLYSPVQKVVITGLSTRDTKFHYMASYDGYLSQADGADYRPFYQASSDMAFFLVRLTNYHECYTGLFTCYAEFLNPEHVLVNDTDTFIPDFRVDEYYTRAVKNVTEITYKEFSRIKATEMQLTERYRDLLKMDKAMNAIFGVIEPNKCEREMPQNWDRTIVQLPGYSRVMCDTKTDNGGWIIFLRRTNGKLNMTTSLEAYKKGFGHPESDYWWGLDNLSKLLKTGHYQLRIDGFFRRDYHFAVYDDVKIHHNYALTFGSFFAGKDPFKINTHPAYLPWGEFDADFNNRSSCAAKVGGAFWFKSQTKCGEYISPTGHWMSHVYPMSWEEVTGLGMAMDSIELKVRER